MNDRSFRGLVFAGLVLLCNAAFADVVIDWNSRADAIAADKKISGPVHGRTLALMHVAMFEALNAIDRRYQPYRLNLVADRDTSDSKIPNIVLSTAHPAKFPDAVEAACGVRPQLPAWLDGLMTKSEHITVMKNDSAEVERFVRSVSRAAKQGVTG